MVGGVDDLGSWSPWFCRTSCSCDRLDVRLSNEILAVSLLCGSEEVNLRSDVYVDAEWMDEQEMSSQKS